MNLRIALVCMAPLLIQAVAQQNPARQLTADSVISMAQAGLSDDVIMARLRKEDRPMDLSTDDLIRLKKANVSDAVLKVMMDPKSQPAAIAVPIIAGLPTVTPSGATPGAGATFGDPNDPITPHDSGIYLYALDRDGKPQMIVLELAAYQGAKTRPIFGTI